MTIEDHPLDEVEPRLWHELLSSSGSVSPFCRYSWLMLLQSAYPLWRVVLVLAHSGGRLLAGLPYVSSSRLFFHQSHSLPWGTPGGVLLSGDADPALAARLVGFWTSRNSGACRPCRLSLTFPGLGAAGEARKAFRACREQRQRSLAVPLAGRSLEQWEASLDDSVRNQNRQALQRGATFEQVLTPGAAPEIFRLAGLTAHRHGRKAPPLCENFYRLLLEPGGPLAEEPELARVFMVRVNGMPAAFSVCLTHAGRLWLWDYGADSSLYDARPNNLMYSRVISLAFGQGLDAVDLGAVPAGADSLARFKSGFGGMPYERTSWVAASALFRLAAAASRLGGR
ncbi:MAG: GNAT family N-acetyltransferase [Candidatus Glassbacteria bacterium]|nr:GNAT family N-acetyltransferase [Candidatus Glassbacteria bacterium]